MWHLIVKTVRDEYVIFVGGSEETASAVLTEAQAHIGTEGVVRIANRLSKSG